MSIAQFRPLFGRWWRRLSQHAPIMERDPAASDQRFAPIALPGGHSRFRTIALPLIGVLVLVASWTAGVSYYFHQRSAEQLFIAEQRDKAERAAALVNVTIGNDYRGIEQAVRTMAERPDLIAALQDGGDEAVRTWAQRSRRLGSDVAIEVYNARGQLVERVGDPAQYRLDQPAKAALLADALAGRDGLLVDAQADSLALRAAAPVIAGAHIVGAAVAEQPINAEYLAGLANRLGLDVALVRDDRVLVASARPAEADWSAKDVSLAPFMLADVPMAVAVFMPNKRAYDALSDSTRAFALVVLLTILATIVAGLYLSRYLIQPVKALTERAQDLSQRFAGSRALQHGDELDSLVRSFEAMTSALLSHSDRLARAHKSELQNSLELQRQYAQMRLLRSLAAAANESGSVESTLERALHEIGAYLDWPLGRVVLQQSAVANAHMPPASIWYTRDAERFSTFIEASNRTPLVPSPEHLIGRAFLSGTPHWVSDLSRMSEWDRLVEALDAGLHTGLVIPVMARGHVTAFIEFFCDHRVEATNEQLELLEAISAELTRVAERQRVERELLARELEASRLAMVASRTDQMVMILDSQGCVEWANDACARFSGYSLQDARGKPAHTLMRGPETDPTATGTIADAVARGEPCRVEFVAYTRDGDKRVLEVEGQPLRDEHGRYFQYALISPDITERKRTEAALRESAEYFRALFDESPVAAAIQAPDMRVVRANAAHSRMLGYSIDQVIGKDRSASTTRTTSMLPTPRAVRWPCASAGRRPSSVAWSPATAARSGCAGTPCASRTLAASATR
jgi:PAS domain S-box-containing protein